MKIKNIIAQTKLSEAPGNRPATVTQPQPTLRGANQPFSMADIPSGMRDTLQNGPKGRTGFAANDNRELVKKAREMIGNAGATAEEIAASPWYSKWYKTFASGVKSVGGAGIKLIGKIALPLTVGMAMYEGYVAITDIDKSDPDRRNKIIAIVTKLVAEYGFPVVAGYLGALAGGAVGAVVGGVGAVPGALIGSLASTAAAFVAQYQYGEDIDQAIDDLVDNVLMDAAAPDTADSSNNVTGDDPISNPDTTATVSNPTPRSATGTYTTPYDIKPNPLVNPNPDSVPITDLVTDPAIQPKAKPKTALAPSQELARQTDEKPKTATLPAAASTASKTPPNTPTVKLPVTTYTPTVPNIPKVTIPTQPPTQPNYDDLTFRQAFARARERARQLSPGDAGQYTFTWRGKPYQTNYKGTGTAAKPNEPYIPQKNQRGMMSTAPINNPYENPKRNSINEAGGAKGYIGDSLVSFGEWIAKMLGRGEKIVDAGKVAGKIVDATIGGKKYKYFEDVIDGSGYWYDVEKAAAGGRKSAGKITKESDPALFDELSKIRSLEADAAAAAAKGATTGADDAVAAGDKLTAKLSPAAIKALNDTDVERWTVAQLASLGFNKSHVPMLSAARKAGVNIVATAEEMLASPWYLGWEKFTNARKYAFKGSTWFADKTLNFVFWGWMVGDAVIEGFNRMADLDPNDPNYKRRVTEIWVEEAAKVGTEILFWHVAGMLSKYGLRKIGAAEKWPVLAGLVVSLSKGSGALLAKKYAMQGGTLTGGYGIEDIVDMISDIALGPIDRSPGAGTLENTPLYKKAYQWALDAGATTGGATRYAKMVAAEGPNGPIASQLDRHIGGTFESMQLAYLYNKLDESTNARNTVNIHNLIKCMLSESDNSDVLERSAYIIQVSGILNEAGGIYGGGTGRKPPVATKSNVVPFAKPGQAAKAAKALPAPDAANVAKLIKSPGMRPILKTVFFKVLPGLGLAISGYDVITNSLEGNWTDAFLNLASMGLNIAQIGGYIAGPAGVTASIADFALNLYFLRAPIMKLYYGVILGMDLSDYTTADLEDSANTLVKAIATQLVADMVDGVTGALSINEDVDNDNFMTNVTAAIAANTKGDKVGAQKALDAAKLNNPATGTDQTNQKKMLDQLAKDNPSLAVPNTNPNSTQNQTPNPNATQSNMEEATGYAGPPPANAANNGDILQAYNEFAAQYPAAKFLLDILPVTGTATSIIDASQDLSNGNYGEAAIDILGAIPGFKIGKYLSRGLQNAVHAINQGARAVNAANATSNYADSTYGAANVPVPKLSQLKPGQPADDGSNTMNEITGPKMGDHILLELADGRVIVAPISELRGNSMIVTLDETGHQWLEESPGHDALKIGDGTQAISSTAQFWNSMIDTLTNDTPAGWAQLFVNLQNTTGHAARTMPHQWANIWRQQHIALGDELTRGDMMTWVKEVESAIDDGGLEESSLNPVGGSELRKMLDSKDPAMLAVWMSSRAGSQGISIAKFAKDKAVQSGLPANHWWSKIKNLVNETADPYSMEKRYYIVRKTSSAAPADGVSGFHRKSEADKKLATMKNPDQYMVRAIDSTKLPKDEFDEAAIPGINTKDTRYDYFKHGRWVIMVSKEPVLMPALTGPNPKYVAKAMLSDDPRKLHISAAMTQNGAVEDVSRKAIDANRASLDPDDYENYVVDFNVDFTREYMDPKTGHFFKFEKGADGQPRLISVGPEWYQKFGTEMDQLGFRRASDKSSRNMDTPNTPTYSFPIGKPMVKQLGLIPNMRYSLEFENEDADGNDIFTISQHSRYTGKGTRMMMRTPGFILAASPKNKTDTPPSQYVNDMPGLASAGLDEAEYNGKSVPLSKPIRTSPSEGGKFKVYVKDPKTGNIKMVRFGDTTGLSIKRDDPARRKNYRARHHCENPGPRTKANFWSCKMWTAKPVGKILKGK